MKISFECECVLLQRALILFLNNCVSTRNDCDFVISDRKIDTAKPVFIVGEKSPYLPFPFDKQTLLSALNEFYSAILADLDGENANFEQKLACILDKFKLDIMQLINEELKK